MINKERNMDTREGVYESPTLEVFVIQTEGVLCESFSREPGPSWDGLVINNIDNE